MRIMTKLSTVAAILAAAGWLQTTAAAEFASEVAATTVQLQNEAAQAAPVSSTTGTARDMAQAWLNRVGKHQGVNETVLPDGSKETVLIYLGFYSNKANSRTVNDVRAIGAMVAQLNAKAELAKFLNSTVSADIRSVMPQRTPLETEFDRQNAELQEQLNKLLADYEDAVRELDASKADQIGQLGLDEIFKEGLTAALSSRGLDFEQVEKKKAAKLEKLRAVVTQLDDQIRELKKQQEKLAGALNSEDTTSLQQLASMLISGAVVVNSWESMQDGTYETAVAVVWSPAQERFMRSTLGVDKTPVKLRSTTGRSLGEYIRANQDRWQNMVGGRWFVDRDGMPHLIAIGAKELRDGQTATRKRAQIAADADAMHNLAMALQADTAYQMQAERKVQNLAGADGAEKTESADKLAQEVSASVKDLKLQGVNKIFESERPSPVSSRTLWVSVYEFSPLSKRSAETVFEGLSETARAVGEAQNELKGYIEETRQQVKAAQSDAEAYARGRNKGQKDTSKAIPVAKDNASSYGSASDARDDGRLRNHSFGDAGEEDFKF